MMRYLDEADNLIAFLRPLPWRLSKRAALWLCFGLLCYGAPFQNGSFELGVSPNRDLLAGSTAITGWVVSGGLIAWVSGDGAGNGASDGTYFVDLNGCAGPEGQNCIVQGGIQQTFDTIVGTTYTVKFDLRSNDDPFFGPPVPNTVQVSAAGVNQNYSTPTSAWQTFTFQFTATAAQTTLSFVSLSPQTAGPELDNVRVISCALPDREDSAFFDWDPQNGERTEAFFTATLVSQGGLDFVGRTIDEETPPEDVNPVGDTCWNLANAFLGAAVPKPPPYISVLSNGPFMVGGGNLWTDHIGWNETQVEFYLKLLNDTGHSKCGTVIKQQMTMACSDNTFHQYATNYITETIIAPNHPNEPGQVVIARCSDTQFDVSLQCPPPPNTASTAWFAAKGRNK